MYIFNNNYVLPIRAQLKYTSALVENSFEQIRPFSSVAEATKEYNAISNQVQPLHQFVPYENLAPRDECIIFGYGYGSGEQRTEIRDSDQLDDQFYLRPWPAGGEDNLNNYLYHNTWRTFTYTFNYTENFRLYLKYGNGFGTAYIKNILIDDEPIEQVYPDINAQINEFEGNEVLELPPDWSKGFLLPNYSTSLSEGEHTISFDYYVDAPVQYTDPPLEPRHIYKDVTMETFDVSDCEWMEGLYFATKEDADTAYEMGEEAYLRSLPDTNARLTEQVTALEMAIVDIYESMEG